MSRLRPGSQSNRFELEFLEQRILLSGDGLAAAAQLSGQIHTRESAAGLQVQPRSSSEDFVYQNHKNPVREAHSGSDLFSGLTSELLPAGVESGSEHRTPVESRAASRDPGAAAAAERPVIAPERVASLDPLASRSKQDLSTGHDVTKPPTASAPEGPSNTIQEEAHKPGGVGADKTAATLTTDQAT